MKESVMVQSERNLIEFKLKKKEWKLACKSLASEKQGLLPFGWSEVCWFSCS